ncbi:MAG: hypothetical protein HY255_11615 [Betaproteobacteria bacterium]|nr:hypothetical protein [Betaproteobacteria bacterium]
MENTFLAEIINSMNFTDAQKDKRSAYFVGATGMFAAATARLAAEFVALNGTPKRAVPTLFVGRKPPCPRF